MAKDDLEPYMRGRRVFRRSLEFVKPDYAPFDAQLDEETDKAIAALLAVLRARPENQKLTTYKYNGALKFCSPSEMAATFLEDLLREPEEHTDAIEDLLWQVRGECDYEGREATVWDLFKEWTAPFMNHGPRIAKDWTRVRLLEYWEDEMEIFQAISFFTRNRGQGRAWDDSTLI
jgi:hypothetical protein